MVRRCQSDKTDKYSPLMRRKSHLSKLSTDLPRYGKRQTSQGLPSKSLRGKRHRAISRCERPPHPQNRPSTSPRGRLCKSLCPSRQRKCLHYKLNTDLPRCGKRQQHQRRSNTCLSDIQYNSISRYVLPPYPQNRSSTSPRDRSSKSLFLSRQRRYLHYKLNTDLPSCGKRQKCQRRSERYQLGTARKSLCPSRQHNCPQGK